jgi:hypothetical protein
MKGQTSMIAIVIAIVMVAFIALFMFTSTLTTQSSQSTRNEYRSLFATNLLLSMLNMETDCGPFSDFLENALEGVGGDCGKEEFERRFPRYVDAVLNATGHTDYDWYFEVTPKDFVSTTYRLGNPAVTDTRGFWDATSIMTWGGNPLEVKLYIRTK